MVLRVIRAAGWRWGLASTCMRRWRRVRNLAHAVARSADLCGFRSHLSNERGFGNLLRLAVWRWWLFCLLRAQDFCLKRLFSHGTGAARLDTPVLLSVVACQ